MTLDEYLWRNKLRADFFAAEIQVTGSMVTFLRNGRRRPSVDLAQRIEKATKGQVTAVELLGLATMPAAKELVATAVAVNGAAATVKRRRAIERSAKARKAVRK